MWNAVINHGLLAVYIFRTQKKGHIVVQSKNCKTDSHDKNASRQYKQKNLPEDGQRTNLAFCFVDHRRLQITHGEIFEKVIHSAPRAHPRAEWAQKGKLRSDNQLQIYIFRWTLSLSFDRIQIVDVVQPASSYALRMQKSFYSHITLSQSFLWHKER